MIVALESRTSFGDIDESAILRPTTAMSCILAAAHTNGPRVGLALAILADDDDEERRRRKRGCDELNDRVLAARLNRFSFS